MQIKLENGYETEREVKPSELAELAIFREQELMIEAEKQRKIQNQWLARAYTAESSIDKQSALSNARDAKNWKCFFYDTAFFNYQVYKRIQTGYVFSREQFDDRHGLELQQNGFEKKSEEGIQA